MLAALLAALQDKPYNGKSDVWALGCVLYELCTLRRPFGGQSVSAIAVKILRQASFCSIHAVHALVAAHSLYAMALKILRHGIITCLSSLRQCCVPGSASGM